MKTNNKQGFTLVELAITIVIIGLMIGGLLVGQSLISGTKINAQVAQIGQFDAGVLAFKTKYKYLPGDAPAFGGNGNGVLNGGSVYNYEMANFWYNYDSNLFPTRYASGNALPGITANTDGANKNVPASKMGKGKSFFIVYSMSVDWFTVDMTNPQSYYVLLGASQLKTTYNGIYATASTLSSNSAVKPDDLLALDKKMDDGVGTTGNVKSGSISCSAGTPGVAQEFL
jgi:prepilin-type N-terminal cleavage/methylation domain-containing protein